MYIHHFQNIFVLTMTLAIFSCQGSRTTDGVNQTEQTQTDSAKKAKVIRKEVKEDLDIYFSAKQNRNFQQMLDKTYDGIFEVSPRDSVLKDLQEPKPFEEKDFTYEIKRVSPVVDDNGKVMVVVKFTFEKLVVIKEGEKIKPKALKELFQERYGWNVKFEEESRTFHINARDTIFGIKKDGEDEWKFMTFDQSQDPAYRKLISLETYKKLIEYE